MNRAWAAGGLRRAAEELHNQDPGYRRAANLDFLKYVVLVALLVFALRAFIGEPVRVLGDSMYPTLEDQERMIVDKVSYYVEAPQRGDIIVCYYPGYTESCVKRVIGLPGDTIAIRGGQFLLNGKLLEESAYWQEYMYDYMEPHTVKSGHVFVVGDNRNYSGDSRDPRIGDIPYDQIVGRAVCVLWPPKQLRGIHRVEYEG